jgi:RimJ/RimL family protein N-acetyltransferase
MELRALERLDVEEARKWRNKARESLRTPYLLTIEDQQDFFDDLACGDSPHRYFTIWDNGLIGVGGLTNIMWENRMAEISLIINPIHRKKGNGERAVSLLLDEAFNRMNLKTVFGECYICNQAWEFWQKIAELYDGFYTTLPCRKYWDGNYFGSLYFSVNDDGFNKIHSAIHEAG